jgi:hypothetical protein
MKKVILASIVLFCVGGCVNRRVLPIMSLNGVLINNTIETKSVKGNTFDDGKVSITVIPASGHFRVEIKNKSNAPRYVAWEESALFMPDGFSERIIPKTNNRIDARKTMSNTTIIQNSGISVDVYRAKSYHARGVIVDTFYSRTSKSKRVLRNLFGDDIGKEIKLYLQLRDGKGVDTGYMFVFNIDDLRFK